MYQHESHDGIKWKQDSPAQLATVSSTQLEKSKPAAEVTWKPEPPATDSAKMGHNIMYEILSVSSPEVTDQSHLDLKIVLSLFLIINVITSNRCLFLC